MDQFKNTQRTRFERIMFRPEKYNRNSLEQIYANQSGVEQYKLYLEQQKQMTQLLVLLLESQQEQTKPKSNTIQKMPLREVLFDRVWLYRNLLCCFLIASTIPIFKPPFQALADSLYSRTSFAPKPSVMQISPETLQNAAEISSNTHAKVTFDGAKITIEPTK